MRRVIGIAVVSFLLLGLPAVLLLLQKSPASQPVTLAGGRTIHIEAVTFGTNHQVGVRSIVLDRFGPWLPQWLRPVFEPKFPRSRITTTHPALVLWMNATDSAGKSVDPQGIRVELVNEHGELFGETDSSWFGFGKVSRVGHVFESYPRHLKQLKVQFTPWRSNHTTVATVINPRVQTAASWQGAPLPAKQRFGQTEVILQSLSERSRTSNYWQAASRYWEPTWELLQNGSPASAWDPPEWTAEDPFGNRGKYIGLHQPVLRYSATFYPSATNQEAALLVVRLPSITLKGFGTNILWNTNLSVDSAAIFVLGVLPKGVTTFRDGTYDPLPATVLTAVRGGAPSGWVGSSRRVTPSRVQRWHGHYTPVPTLYLQPRGLKSDVRIGVRLRDEQGQYWLARAEEQTMTYDVRPFLFEVPPEIKVVTPEVVLLRPVQATFQVRTPAP